MTRRPSALLAILVLASGALASCAPARPPVATAPARPADSAPDAPAGQCRVGPDGGPLLADRGIGGTGAPTTRVADRGIGGTGAPASGILGVITGFASVCLAGEEVQYAADTPIQIDNVPARAADLRAGQVAAIAAAGPHALRVTVRHEVSGPLDAIEPSGIWRVAGQPVLPPPDTAPPPGPGTWLAVSGFRREDGAIAATRLDVRPAGETLIRGTMTYASGRLFIGLVEIRPGPGQFRRPGVPVAAIGRLVGGVLNADTVEPDALLLDPNVYFGTPGILVIQGYAQDGFVSFGGRRYDAPFRPGLATLRLERGATGQFSAVSIRPFGAERPVIGPNAGSRTGFQPAPMPNRGLGRASGPAPGDGNRAYGSGSRGRQDGRDNSGSPDATPRNEPNGGGYGGGRGGFGGFGGGRGR